VEGGENWIQEYIRDKYRMGIGQTKEERAIEDKMREQEVDDLLHIYVDKYKEKLGSKKGSYWGSIARLEARIAMDFLRMYAHEADNEEYKDLDKRLDLVRELCYISYVNGSENIETALTMLIEDLTQKLERWEER
jgi:hypothetical protein